MINRIYSPQTYSGKDSEKPVKLELGDKYISTDTSNVYFYGESGVVIETNSSGLSIGENGNFFIDGADTGIPSTSNKSRENVYTVSSSNITPLEERLGEVVIENFSSTETIDAVSFDGTTININNIQKDIEVEAFMKTFGNVNISRPLYFFEENISMSVSDNDGSYGNFNISPTNLRVPIGSTMQIKLAHSSSLGNHKISIGSFIKIKEL